MKKYKTVKSALKAMLKLFEDKSHWMAGRMAATVDGRGVGPLDNDAVCWCLAGAARKVNGPYDGTITALAEQIAPHPTFWGEDAVTTYNDERYRTIGEVRKVLRDAIAAA